jgi:hypothetical protein
VNTRTINPFLATGRKIFKIKTTAAETLHNGGVGRFENYPSTGLALPPQTVPAGFRTLLLVSVRIRESERSPFHGKALDRALNVRMGSIEFRKDGVF